MKQPTDYLACSIKLNCNSVTISVLFTELIDSAAEASISSASSAILPLNNVSAPVKKIVTPKPPTTESPLKPLVDTEIQLTRKCFDFDNETNLCVENSEEWFHILHRPISLLPFDREVVNTRFILYTKNTTDEVTDNNLKPHICDNRYDS